MRRFSWNDPWVSVTVVAILSILALVYFRQFSSDSRKRFEMLHGLSDLADSQSAFRQRHGYYAAHIGYMRGDSTVILVDTMGAVFTITHADSVGWTASALNPLIATGIRRCYIYGGGEIPHAPTLDRPGVPKCW